MNAYIFDLTTDHAELTDLNITPPYDCTDSALWAANEWKRKYNVVIEPTGQAASLIFLTPSTEEDVQTVATWTQAALDLQAMVIIAQATEEKALAYLRPKNQEAQQAVQAVKRAREAFERQMIGEQIAA